MIIDSTNLLNTTIDSKAKLSKNMNKDNYFLKTLQQKIDAEWTYRYNVVDIWEETTIGSGDYNQIEAVIDPVIKDTKETGVANDIKRLIFKDIQHNIGLGYRYKFSNDFNNQTLTDDDKSIWITINLDETSPQNSAVIKRCTTYLTIEEKNSKAIHKEPALLEDEFKFTSMRYNLSITVPQAQIYFILQYNKYTKNIKINDRFIIGPSDTLDRENNKVFKAVAITKFHSQKTFVDEDVRLICIAADLDNISSDDNVETRIMTHNPYYIDNTDDYIDDSPNNIEDVNNDVPNEITYKLEINPNNSDFIGDILLNTTEQFTCSLKSSDNTVVDNLIFTVTTDLLSTTNDAYYYTFNKKSFNVFEIKNIKMYLKDKLKITCSVEYNNKLYEKIIYVNLRGNN